MERGHPCGGRARRGVWWVCITFPVSRALHTDRVEVSLTGRVSAPAAPVGSCLLCKKLLLYRIANNSILFSAVHHAQHAHTVKPRIRPTVGTGLAASPGLSPYPIAGCRAYSGATRSVHYTSDHHHAAVWRSCMSASRVGLLATGLDQRFGAMRTVERDSEWNVGLRH